MHPNIAKILVTEEEIRDRVAVLGREITNDYRGKKIAFSRHFERFRGIYGRFDAPNRFGRANRFYGGFELQQQHAVAGAYSDP